MIEQVARLHEYVTGQDTRRERDIDTRQPPRIPRRNGAALVPR